MNCGGIDSCTGATELWGFDRSPGTACRAFTFRRLAAGALAVRWAVLSFKVELVLNAVAGKGAYPQGLKPCAFPV
jgi:hypothetical protein